MLAAGGRCLQLADTSTARALSSAARCIFNQAISSALLSNFWPGSGPTEGKGGVDICTHKHNHKYEHKYEHEHQHTQLCTCTPLPQSSHPPVFTGYKALPGHSPPGVFLSWYLFPWPRSSGGVPWCCPSGAPVSLWHILAKDSQPSHTSCTAAVPVI